MDELKPCPFCGGRGHIKSKAMRYFGMNELGFVKERRGYYVQCGCCKARGGVFAMTIIKQYAISDEDKELFIDGAIKNWNYRRTTK